MPSSGQGHTRSIRSVNHDRIEEMLSLSVSPTFCQAMGAGSIPSPRCRHQHCGLPKFLPVLHLGGLKGTPTPVRITTPGARDAQHHVTPEDTSPPTGWSF